MIVNYIERNQILRGNSGTIYDPNLDIRKNSSTKKVWSVAKLQRERKSICTDLYLRFFPGCCVFFQRKNFNNNVSHSITHLHFIDRLALSLSLSLSIKIYQSWYPSLLELVKSLWLNPKQGSKRVIYMYYLYKWFFFKDWTIYYKYISNSI